MAGKPEAALEALGPYRCLRKLAVGGMGEVWLAEASGAGGFRKRLVIKAVRPDRAEEQEVTQAFLDEAKVWALLTHPNIVPLYDCAWLEGRLCLVMEYVEGADLRELVLAATRLRRAVPGPIAVHLVAQVAAALHAAHEARGLDGLPLGVVHRDVSPHNVLVDRGGNARLCDFGIARSVLRLTRTKAGKFKGKFAYVSPEAIRGEQVDRRGDVFGLGVLLYELLALRRPFYGDGPVGLLRAILETEPTPLREVRRDASVRLAHVIERALAKDAGARYPTAESMRQSLLETPEGQSIVPVARLSDWFDGLTGLGSTWQETQPRYLDLAARSAARAVDVDGEPEEDSGTPDTAEARRLPAFDGMEDRTDPVMVPPRPILGVTPAPPAKAVRASPPKVAPAGPEVDPEATISHTGPLGEAEPTGPVRPAPRPFVRLWLFGEYGAWIVGGVIAGALLTWLIVRHLQ